jgi:uncharacterized protein YbjT (DUF2867 family)
MILVTGGFGSIGAHTALALADLGEHVVVTRHRKAAPPSCLEGRVAVEQADLADLDAVRAIRQRDGRSPQLRLRPCRQPDRQPGGDAHGVRAAADAPAVMSWRYASQ